MFISDDCGNEIIMFICDDCGATFDNYETAKDWVGEWHGQRAYETICVCPYCKSDHIRDKGSVYKAVINIKSETTIEQLIRDLQAMNDPKGIIKGFDIDCIEDV